MIYLFFPVIAWMLFFVSFLTLPLVSRGSTKRTVSVKAIALHFRENCS